MSYSTTERSNGRPLSERGEGEGVNGLSPVGNEASGGERWWVGLLAELVDLGLSVDDPDVDVELRTLLGVPLHGPAGVVRLDDRAHRDADTREPVPERLCLLVGRRDGPLAGRLSLAVGLDIDCDEALDVVLVRDEKPDGRLGRLLTVVVAVVPRTPGEGDDPTLPRRERRVVSCDALRRTGLRTC